MNPSTNQNHLSSRRALSAMVAVAASLAGWGADGAVFHPVGIPAGMESLRLTSMTSDGTVLGGIGREIIPDSPPGGFPRPARAGVKEKGVQIDGGVATVLEAPGYDESQLLAVARQAGGPVKGEGRLRASGGTWSAATSIGNGPMGPLQAPLNTSSSEVVGISADGSVSVGSFGGPVGFRAIKWNSDGLEEELSLHPAYGHSAALDVSGDGSVIAGVGTPAGMMAHPNAVVWRAGNGFTMETLPDDGFGSRASSISPDGRLIGGTMQTGGGQSAGRLVFWENSVASPIEGDLDGDGLFEPIFGDVLAVNSGGLMGGYRDEPLPGGGFGRRAFLYSSTDGYQSAQEWLESRGALGLEGWALTDIVAISEDGALIVGNGFNPEGFEEGWTAQVQIPTPGALTLIGLAGLAATRRRR